MGTATIVIITASSTFKWATAPREAIFSILIDTTTGCAYGARIVTVTNSWWANGRWRRGARIWRILAFLDRVRCFHCNPAFSCSGVGHVTLHLNIAFLSPAWSPWVPDKPVILAIFAAVSNCSHSMVQLGPTCSSEYTLDKVEMDKEIRL